MRPECLYHEPMSQYAFGVSEDTVVIRLRTAKDDLAEVTLYYGDTACRKNPIDFYPVPMERVAFDLYFEYYEARICGAYKRLYYYFLLNDGKEEHYYFSDFVRSFLPEDRSEYYKLPFNHRADIVSEPEWFKDAVVYNIFPDSFATGRGYVAGEGTQKKYPVEPGKDKTVSVTSKLGGTIRGIAENVDYLTRLGINCIYINPLFVGGEYHKYDTVDYFHVDPCFGTDEDFKLMVQTLHRAGIRVIIDGVFNHCGWNHPAFLDVVEKGEKSPYAQWFYGLKFPVVKPENPEDYPEYDCFAYERLMPKLDTAKEEVCNYLTEVGAYWVREFDIDGWRLDVASEVNDDFWRAFRKAVKAAKPDAVLIGEVWESAEHWMQGDMFDSTMNYDVRKYITYYVAQGRIDVATFNAGVTNMLMRYKADMPLAQLNLLDSHDVSRFLSVCEGSEDLMSCAIVLQMTLPGVPSVFYGDEQGFTGVEEKDYRRAMIFPEQESEPELYTVYRQLIQLRHLYPALRRGSFRTLRAEAGEGLYVYSRNYEGEQLVIAVNVDAGRNGAEADDGCPSANVWKLPQLADVIKTKPDSLTLLASRGLEADTLKINGWAIYRVQ